MMKIKKIYNPPEIRVREVEHRLMSDASATPPEFIIEGGNDEAKSSPFLDFVGFDDEEIY